MRDGPAQFVWFRGGAAILMGAFYEQKSKPRYKYFYIRGAA